MNPSASVNAWYVTGGTNAGIMKHMVQPLPLQAPCTPSHTQPYLPPTLKSWRQLSFSFLRCVPDEARFRCQLFADLSCFFDGRLGVPRLSSCAREPANHVHVIVQDVPGRACSHGPTAHHILVFLPPTWKHPKLQTFACAFNIGVSAYI